MKNKSTDPFKIFSDGSHPLIDACVNCEINDFCQDDIHIPPCILNKAGLSVDADLELTFYENGIFITEAKAIDYENAEGWQS